MDTCEEAVGQIFFHNPAIQSPTLNRPFRHTDFPQLSKYLYYLGQLLSRTNMYTLIQPHPTPLHPFLTRRQIEVKFRCTITPLQYLDLINAIPPEIVRTMTSGNVKLVHDGVYIHSSYGHVTYYQVVDTLTHTIAPMEPTPCGFKTDHYRLGIMGQHPYPDRSQLRLTPLLLWM